MYCGKKVRLRAFELDDLDDLVKHIHNLETRQYVAHALPSSTLSQRERLEQMTKIDPWNKGSMALAIEDKETGEFLGGLHLGSISKQNRNADLGIMIHNPVNFGKGYGTDAIRVMLWVAFNILGLESVYLSTFPKNERGQRAFKAAGFKEGGLRRRAIFTMGEFRDIIFMDIMKEEFFERYPPGVTVEEED